MVDVRLPSSGNIKIRWHAVNAFANPAKPTPAEINAGLNLSNAISWNDLDFGLQASNTVSDPAITARSNTSDRGAIQFGGSISFYLPLDPNDTSNEYKLAHDAVRIKRTVGWISIQIDGELSDTNTPTYTGGAVQTAASGDVLDLYKVMTAGYSHAVTGEDAFRETISFLPQGEAYPNAIVGTTFTVAVTPATPTVATGASAQLTATVNGRNYTRGVRWTTSDATKVTVSQNGVVTRVATGSATITANYKGTTGSATVS